MVNPPLTVALGSVSAQIATTHKQPFPTQARSNGKEKATNLGNTLSQEPAHQTYHQFVLDQARADGAVVWEKEVACLPGGKTMTHFGYSC